MNQRRFKKYNLSYEKTFPYFINHIQCGKTLSQKVVEEIDFTNGIFFTLLPDTTDLTKIYQFSYGGIIPSVPYTQSGEVAESEAIYSQEEYYPRQVKTMDDECSLFIYLYLVANNFNCAVVESYVEEVSDPCIGIENVKMVPYENEVYYLIQQKNSMNDIWKTIRFCNENWHSLIILTIMKNLNYKIFTNEDLDQICDNSKYIIVSAYDEEGYIFWERRY